MCVRITSQFVYPPDELAISFYVHNKTGNALREIKFALAPPSCLRGKQEELNHVRGEDEDLPATSSICHVIRLSYQSPAPHIVVNGHVSYKDFTSTEKKIFVSLNVPWSAILRPVDLDTAGFQEGWLNRSLHETRGNVAMDVKLSELLDFLQEFNIHFIKEIGKKIHSFFHAGRVKKVLLKVSFLSVLKIIFGPW